ncbi:hypothetical protein, partial [Ursidibacter maritimus]|uniref:hypothetical protein n=1 Tax=Ursidibacter maritimus TaxID=1331689 RepID=UPI001C44100C
PYLIPADEDIPSTDVPSTRVRAAEDEFRTRQAATIKACNTSHALKVTSIPTTSPFTHHEPEPFIGCPNPHRWINGLGETAGERGDDGKTHAKVITRQWGHFDKYSANFYHPNVIGHEQIAGLAHDVVLSGRAASRSVGAVAGGGGPFDQLGTVPGG